MGLYDALDQQAANDLAFQQHLAHDIATATVNNDDVAFLAGQYANDDAAPVYLNTPAVHPVEQLLLEGAPPRESQILPFLFFVAAAWVLLKGFNK